MILTLATLWSRKTSPAPKGPLFLVPARFVSTMVIRILLGPALGPLLTQLFDLPPDPVP